MIRLPIIALFLLFSTGVLFGKELPTGYDAPVVFGKIDQMKLKKANEMISEGRTIWARLNSEYNPENVNSYKTDSIYNKNAYPLLIKAAKLFQDGNNLKFVVYRSNCDDFYKKHRYDHTAGLEDAKKFQKQSSSYLDSALLNRLAATNYINQYVLAYNRFYEAISLEIIATKKEARALQIYRDWPAHYAYDWDPDVEANLFAVKPKVIEEKILETKPDSAPKAPQLVVSNPSDTAIIFYSIQVAAHTIPLTESHIRTSIYTGPMMIREIHEDGWYKYLIGHYKNLNEAVDLLNRIKVEKAFVVAYKNGKRVNIKSVSPEANPNDKTK
jgi:hypothetical protein